MPHTLWESNAATIVNTVAALIQRERLPDDFSTTVTQYFYPLACNISQLQQQAGRPLIIGINGAQGTGKSTLALFLETLLTELLHCPCARFSIDDIYLTRAEREQLARTVHPLLITRGVPGTHDVALGQRVLDELLAAEANDVVAIPAFDKAHDDRAPMTLWPLRRGAIKVILLEGWCVGAHSQGDAAALQAPINALEQEEDSSGAWRQFVEHKLEGEYRRLFDRLDYLIMLQAPSMECILEWRTLQEQKLAERIGVHHNGAGGDRVMTAQQIKRFVMHYERLTRAMLAEMPARADALFTIDEQHRITGVRYLG